MADIQQPFILQLNGSGNQTMTTSEDEALEPSDNPVVAIITTPQAGPPVPILPDGTPLSFDVSVQTPYSLTMPPGAIVVG